MPGFELADGQDYMLGRGYSATARLNLQFFLWKSALGFNIHPSVPAETFRDIADVAAGTGMWALEVAKQYPSTQVDGYDIDSTQAPHRHWVPSNMTFSEWNMLHDVPSHMVGKYDFIHVRLLCLVLSSETIGLFSKNIMKMLKPGGYFQWDDIDFASMHVTLTPECQAAPGLEHMRELTWANGRQDWLINLPDLLNDQGFTQAKLQQYADPDYLSRAFGDIYLLAMEEFASKVHGLGKVEEAAKMHKIIAEAQLEVNKGAANRVPFLVCVARKPEAL